MSGSIGSYSWVETATIAAGQSLSGAVFLNNQALCGVVIPSGWTAAGVTFQASADGQNWGNVYDNTGAEVTLSAPPAGAYIQLPATLLLGAPWIKARSGTSATPVAQVASAALTLVARRVL